MKKKFLSLLHINVLSFFVIALSIFVFTNTTLPEAKSEAKSKVDNAVISKIKQTKDLKEQTKLYRELIEQVGSIEAQEQLYRSGLPFDGQTHLLNHESGNWLYDRYGTEGLTYCRDYFLSSCYHGFVIRVIADSGIDSLQEVMQTCWKTGSTTATQCSHAIGHGLLAYDGYEKLPQALQECDEVASISHNFPIYNCYDGAFMENVWAIHEGKPSPDQWVSETDHLFPCNSNKINEKYKKACWSNQPSRMYMMFKGDIPKIGEVCLTVKNEEYRKTCFDALARQIHPITAGSVDKTFYYCSLVPKDWQNSCITSVAKSSFSVGSRDVPFEICSRVEGTGKDDCFSQLSGTIKGYATSEKERKSWCSKIDDFKWRENCLKY